MCRRDPAKETAVTLMLEWETTEIGESPELLRLAKVVRDGGQPHLLREDGKAVAVLVPVALAEEFGLRGPISEGDREAFRKAAGG